MRANWKFAFVNPITGSLFLLQLSFACNQAFYFNMGKKLWRPISFSSKCFCYYRKHPNNNKKICPALSSPCFQQQLYDWFLVLRYISDLAKLKWTPLLFNFNQICDSLNRCKFFSIPVAEYASFSHQASKIKTDLIEFNIKFF